ALSLRGAPSWTQILPGGTPPSPRHMMSAIYDPARDRIVVFGGLDRALGYRDDVWALSLGASPAWTRLGPLGVGPAPRARHSATYDPRRNRMIVFGGYHAAVGDSPAGPANDVWALSLSDPPAWTRLVTQGAAPRARYDQSAVYDPVRDCIVVFGGFDGIARLGDVWSLALSGRLRWRENRPEGTLPAPR